MKKAIFILLISFLFTYIFCAITHAEEETLTFTWNQEISSDFAGWHIYQSKTSGVYGEFPAFNILYETEKSEYTTIELITSPNQEEHIYYFVMTAYDTKGNESIYSNECNATIDFKAPNIPFSLIIRIISN